MVSVSQGKGTAPHLGEGLGAFRCRIRALRDRSSAPSGAVSWGRPIPAESPAIASGQIANFRAVRTDPGTLPLQRDSDVVAVNVRVRTTRPVSVGADRPAVATPSRVRPGPDGGRPRRAVRPLPTPAVYTETSFEPTAWRSKTASGPPAAGEEHRDGRRYSWGGLGAPPDPGVAPVSVPARASLAVSAPRDLHPGRWWGQPECGNSREYHRPWLAAWGVPLAGCCGQPCPLSVCALTGRREGGWPLHATSGRTLSGLLPGHPREHNARRLRRQGLEQRCGDQDPWASVGRPRQ